MIAAVVVGAALFAVLLSPDAPPPIIRGVSAPQFDLARLDTGEAVSMAGLRDRVVLINFIYTNCPNSCPLVTYKLKQVKDAIGDRFGKEIFFVSISVDPENDPPAALKKLVLKK